MNLSGLRRLTALPRPDDRHRTVPGCTVQFPAPSRPDDWDDSAFEPAEQASTPPRAGGTAGALHEPWRGGSRILAAR